VRARDFLTLTLGSVRSGHTRSRLTTLGIAIGVAAVVLLTAIGTGVRGFVLGEFTEFGTRVIEITPGQVRTHGLPGGVVGTVRPLLTADA
jgi:putative ABC transport system permease protein